MSRYLMGALLGAALTLTVMAWSCEAPEPLKYTEMVVREIKSKPDTVVQFVERIVYREVQPTLVATQVAGAEDVVSDFCHPDTVVEVIEGDTVYVPAPSYQLWNAVQTKPGWFWGKDRVTLYGPKSNGDLVETQFNAWPGWQAATGSRTLIQEPRWGWARPTLEFLLPLLGGYAIHEVIR